MTDNKETKRGTDEQILFERKLTCEAINGAMAFGYQGTNPPPSDDHWLAPYWKHGARMRELEQVKQAPAVEAWSEPCASCDTPRACQYDGCRRDEMAVEAGARDERAAAFAAIHDFLGIAQKKIHPQPDKPNSDWAKLKAAVDALSHLAALARASEANDDEPRILCAASNEQGEITSATIEWEDVRTRMVRASEAAAGEPIYEVIRGDARENCWSSTDAGVYNATPAYRRRIVYAAPQPASEQQAVCGLSDDARECLMDVVSHHANIVAGFSLQQKFAEDSNDGDNALYWKREIEVAHRMKAQAERVLAAKGDGHE